MQNTHLKIAVLVCLSMIAFTGCGSDSSSNSVTPAPTRNLISNGGFENPVLRDTFSYSTKPFATYDATSYAVPGWTVNSIDVVHAVLWTPFEGRQSVDLNSEYPGWIGTKVASKAGATYTLKFSYATNPAQSQVTPDVRKFRVVWNGAPVETLSVPFSTTVTWKTASVSLVAIGNDSLRFESITSGTGGAALDDISLIGP